MINLVIWAFVVALTPVALGLAGKLILRVEDWIGHGLSRAFGDDHAWGGSSSLDFHPPSVCLSLSGRMPQSAAGRPWAPGRRGSPRD